MMQCLHASDWIRPCLSTCFSYYILEHVPSQCLESFLTLDDGCTVFHSLELPIPVTSLLWTDT